MEITVDYLKDKVHEQYLELQELRKSYDELTKSALRLDKMVKEKQEEIDQLKAREEEHQRLNGELRVEIETLQRQKEELQVNGLRQETLFKLEIERLNKDLETSIEICNNRQKEIVRLNNIISKVKVDINNMKEIIRKQPSEDEDTDAWIQVRLSGLLYIIEGSE